MAWFRRRSDGQPTSDFNILVAEDDQGWGSIFLQAAQAAGAAVFGPFVDRESFDAFLRDEVDSGNVKLDLGLLDGNLSGRDSSGADGRYMVEQLSSRGVSTVGVSGTGEVAGATYQVPKASFDPLRIAQIITELKTVQPQG